MMRKRISLALAAMGLFALTGCDSLNEALGMERIVPDEHAVTTNPPLSLPPDYDLKPPRKSPKSAEKPDVPVAPSLTPQ